ncbi:MAG: GTPase HflX [Methylococcales bacterium]|nr:GTPase HflX [Methylococcales bacterium]
MIEKNIDSFEIKTERCILIGIVLQNQSKWEVIDHIDELKALAETSGAEIVDSFIQNRTKTDAAYFIGKGKLEELALFIEIQEINLVIFDDELSPAQAKNIENILKVKVIDRAALILDIFADHAKSNEAKVQVELAQLNYLLPRLTRQWQHLSRQVGGIGAKGPGETQLETDRRLLGVRIKRIRHSLEKVVKQRHQGRLKRKRAEIPSISLVGYTNAGKSTLFNTLTGARIFAANQLFATLDPTLRQCLLSNGSKVVLADTVGFIRHLPHELVAAFRSTLQEAVEADLLLHIIDANAEDRDDTIFHVNKILAEIGADEVKQLEIFNKIDLLEGGVQPRIDRDEQGRPVRVWLSAQNVDGSELLLQALTELFSANTVNKLCHLQPSQGNIRAKLFPHAHIVREANNEHGGWDLEIEIDKKHLGLLEAVESEDIS